ncbi:PAAR domain-containing protein [Escherichia coli]|nr:PAAR domain-containing protein [Escherichia coli]
MSEGPGGPQGATAGGTLAMRMLSQQAMVASQMKRAANDKAIAQMLAAKKSGPPAARLGDEIQHKSFLGALAGAVLGAIVTIAEGCLIMAACATGPYALVLVPALMYASYKASDYVEEKQNQLESWINSFCDTDGAINTGSENVNINGKPAARAAVTLPPPPPPGAIPEIPQGEPSWGDIATDLLESAAEKAVPLAKAWGNAVITLTESNAGFMDRVSAGASLLFPAGPVLMEFATMVGGRSEIKKDVDFPEAGEDTALCDKENKPPRIAQGSSNVFINNQPAARKGDKLECSAAIVGGSPDVFIGGEQVTYLDIQPEFPPWQRMILGGITIASYLLPPAGLLGKLKNLARLGKLGNLLGKSGKQLGAKLGALLGKTGKSLKSIANKVIRWVTDPVVPVTGAYCDERTDFTLGQTLPLSFTRFHSSVLPLHGLTGVGWSDSWSEYAWVREQGNRVDIISQGATLNFAFDGDSDTAVNPYHAQYILRRRDDYLELFDRDALSSRFFYDAFPGMRLRHPVTDDTSDDRLAHSPDDRMYMLGGMSDTASNRITFERDSQYRITGVSHTDGIRLKLTYHASGYLKAIHRTDNGIQTLATYEQDARGRLTEADARLDYHLFYEYDAADRIIRWSDNDQTWSRFTYDAQGRCVNVTGAEGYYNATLDYGDGCTTVTDGKGTHRYYYDPDGNILREEAPDGSTTTYEWDEFHHLLARHSPAGRVEKFEYNAALGQLSRYTAADGAEWLYRYDERGLLSNITDPAGQTWTQQCDERGLPVSLVSPQGEETRLAYTAQGLLSGIFRQDERRLGIEYDHHNRPETLTDVMGREHHTEYSGHDLPVKMRGPGGQSVRLQWQQHHKLSGLERAETGAEGFRYDRHGNLLAYTDGNGVVWTMEYGPFDLPVARTDGEGHRWQYRYDKDTLQLTEVINPQGESYRYILDNCGRVTEERDWGGVVWRYRYDADGLCTARVNGLEETILYSRDAAGRLAEVITPEGKTQYAYDKSGRLTGIFSPDGTSQRTGYDERGRVNVTTQGRRAIEYHYPDEHTVIRCILPPEDERDRHPDESLLKTTYRYNASGRRTEKRCDRKKIRFTYLWDGDSIAEIREYRDDKLYSVRHLVFNGFELISQQFSRVRQAHPSVAPQWVTRTNHAVSDLTGRPLMLFNSEGKTVWRPGQTSLWGLALSLPADTGYPDPRGEWDPEADPGLLYAGQWQDAESGLCYNRFRYYEPETGMYLVSDPLGLQGGEQTYRYVPNPLGYIDPLGLAKTSVPAEKISLSDKARDLFRQGKVREALDVHYEDLVRRKLGGISQEIAGREYDVVTDKIIAQVKRTYSSIDNPKNFLSKSTRTQIKKTIELAEEQGKEAQFWFKYGVSPKVREYIESKGGKVILGMGN